jgi:sulfide:quinone oxidoreductase
MEMATPSNQIRDHYKILILGGGSAGISVAARLRKKLSSKDFDLAIVEPSATHDYQPLWTLVGAGVCKKEETRRQEAPFIPSGATWIQDRVERIDGSSNAITLASGKRVTYDYLVVSLGIKILWDGIPGLKETIGKNGVCSNYSYETAEYTWECIRNFKGGTAIFTMPSTPVKCGGAPQKIMYLADDALRRQGVRDKSRVVFVTPQKAIFAIERYRKTLEGVITRKSLEMQYQHEVTAIDGPAKKATVLDKQSGESTEMAFEMIHVTPPMGPMDPIKTSDIADDNGWVAVDKYSLQSTKFPNVFGLGDCINAPCAKTGAAVRKQAPVVVENLLSQMQSKALEAKYNGYGSCPLVTGYGKLILAEFGYDGAILESFPIDQSKERWSMYMLKRHLLPQLYWHGMLKGRA